MHGPDFIGIVKNAWLDYDNSRDIVKVLNISAMVSTNHVFKITFTNGDWIVAKVSYFGKYEHFVEDHTIINGLGNNLPAPFENFLAKSLIKGSKVFTYRYTDEIIDAWVVFYNPVRIQNRLPKKLKKYHIEKLGSEFGKLHKACAQVKNTLPSVSKTLKSDLEHLLDILDSDFGKFEHRMNQDEIKKQCAAFFENCDKLGYDQFVKIPIFVDWNIGNFSINEDCSLFSRWDYDWFRVDSRMVDFYFFSRICSSVGDRTLFQYNIDPLMEDRFIWFLKKYHEEYPLAEAEIWFMKEAYRFFLLNYVVKDGRYFFHEIYASKLRKEAYEHHFPELDKAFNPDKILKELGF